MFIRAKYQLYLFQLENYHVRRYAGLISHFFSAPPKKFRQQIVWTGKLKALTAIALSVQALAAIALSLGAGWYFFVARNFSVLSVLALAVLVLMCFAALSWIFFIFLLSAYGLLLPLDSWLKHRLVRKARVKIAALADLKVIGIAGSYGKTTMKEMVAAVLASDFEVLQTPESVNTPLGIARLVLSKVTSRTQIFVMEMGEHVPGDIRDICAIAKPDLGIITGINEAHLERMGDIQKTIGTIFELAQVPGDFPILMNADDRRVSEYWQAHIGSHRPVFYSASGDARAEYVVRHREFHADASGNSFELFKGNEKEGNFTTRLLGAYAVGTAAAAVSVARHFGVSLDKVRAAIAAMSPVHHRLEPVPNRNGVIVIDDSYNGNPQGVREAIQVLSGFPGRRIYITPGLVEMGARAEDIHRTIGRDLASVADKVILIKNSVTPWLIAGLKQGGFSEANLIIYPSAAEAHSALGGIVRPGDTVLFQNDWPDNYF